MLVNNQLIHPYYIIAPRYVRTSGGVRVLYRLADSINRLGGSAYVFLWPHFNMDISSSPMDIAPFLNKRIIDYHFNAGITPIVIYPETIRVSKFVPPVRVRYLLNYDELLDSNESLDEDDYILSFSQAVNAHINTERPCGTLFLPVSDHVFFSPPSKSAKRTGGAFYAGKYKYHFGGKTLPITDGLLEITRDQPDSQTPDEIRDMFRRIEYFYCYEDSALALEAILCGCPTVFLPNEYFKVPLGAKELNGLGFAWGATPEQMRHAKETVAAARAEHLRRLDEIQDQVLLFIEETQQIAKHKPYETPFAEKYIKSPSYFRILIDIFQFIRNVIDDRGMIGTIKIISKRVMAKRTAL